LIKGWLCACSRDGGVRLWIDWFIYQRDTNLERSSLFVTKDHNITNTENTEERKIYPYRRDSKSDSNNT
jgi:hypothetical protein